MKAHKYWSLGALACMAGCFYTGYKKLMQAHKYFACGSLICMGMAIYSGHKIAPKKKKVGLLIVTSCIPLYPTALFHSFFNSTRCFPCVVFRAKQLQRDHSQTANKNTLLRWLYYILVNIGRQERIIAEEPFEPQYSPVVSNILLVESFLTIF